MHESWMKSFSGFSGLPEVVSCLPLNLNSLLKHSLLNVLTLLCGFILQVCISFVKILYNVTRPHTARLGNIPGTSVYRNVNQYPEATLVPGILPIRVDAAIYFSNSNYIHDKILGYLEEELRKLEKSGGPNIQYLIVDLTRKFPTSYLQF